MGIPNLLNPKFAIINYMLVVQVMIKDKYSCM